MTVFALARMLCVMQAHIDIDIYENDKVEDASNGASPARQRGYSPAGSREPSRAGVNELLRCQTFIFNGVASKIDIKFQ